MTQFVNSKIILVIVFYVVIALSTLTRSNALSINDQKLPAIELTGNYITPPDGIDTTYARKLINSELVRKDYNMDLYSEMQIQEMTTTELWLNNHTQLYRINDLSSMMCAIVFIKDSTVLDIQYSKLSAPVFLADLDNDGFYEVYFNVFVGFGLISEDVFGYNIETRENYHLSMRCVKDIHLYVDQGVLMSVSRSYKSNRPHSKYSDPRRIILKTTMELKLDE